jgi:hypothetical protein
VVAGPSHTPNHKVLAHDILGVTDHIDSASG